MTEGTCLCGTVRFAVGEVRDLAHCHCSMCRKHHGAPFATMARVPSGAFRWFAGEEAIRRYESSPGFHRSFCGTCGSSLPDRSPSGGWFVPAGLFIEDPGVRPIVHIFRASRAPWHTIADELPGFDEWPPRKARPVIERPAPADRTGPDGLRGSCLCGGIAYEVTAPFTRVYNCHCSRCRQVRAAAHATNGLAPVDGVRLVRGEDLAVLYRLPGARLFAHAFCRRCGSGVPRRDPEWGAAVIPFGSLDDDPGRRADCHIFVGSRAPWYEFEDDLPRFDEGAP